MCTNSVNLLYCVCYIWKVWTWVSNHPLMAKHPNVDKGWGDKKCEKIVDITHGVPIRKSGIDDALHLPCTARRRRAPGTRRRSRPLPPPPPLRGCTRRRARTPRPRRPSRRSPRSPSLQDEGYNTNFMFFVRDGLCTAGRQIFEKNNKQGLGVPKNI